MAKNYNTARNYALKCVLMQPNFMAGELFYIPGLRCATGYLTAIPYVKRGCEFMLHEENIS